MVESTNSRVKWFSILLMTGTIGLGAWQVSCEVIYGQVADDQLFHLRSFFRRKYLID